MAPHPPVAVPAGEYVPTADQRVVTFGVPWPHYEAQLALRGEAPVPRMAYLEGALELMSPSKEHERVKSVIGRLIEAYALERGIDLSPYGAWTLKSVPKLAGVEPDECYIVGSDQDKTVPDLAIEVLWTSGGIDKLEIYRRLGVNEVWFWQDGRIQIHVRRGDRFEPADRSHVLQDLDIGLLGSFLDRPTVMQAVRAFRDALRG
ncbi:MAG: Uma2 family endonuclease [Acidobacteriota bacterium]